MSFCGFWDLGLGLRGFRVGVHGESDGGGGCGGVARECLNCLL